MTKSNSARLVMLAAASPLALSASAFAQDSAEPVSPAAEQGAQGPRGPAQSVLDPYADAESAAGEDEAIVVTGERQRGAVVGDIPPEQQLDAGDIRALGVSSVSDLLTELGPQVQSASGRPPVMLLEGHRMSSPREIASLPSEAIERVDVLPEEVGLRYGYGADQKVVNIVLRERFRAVTGELESRIPTAGGAVQGQGELGFLSIRNGKRFNVGMEVELQDDLLESERGLAGPDSAFRTLIGSSRNFTLNATYHQPLTDRLSATINGELKSNEGTSLIGRSLLPVLIPGGTPYATDSMDRYFTPTASGIGPLERSNTGISSHIGFGVIRDHSKGQVTLTGNYDHSYSRSISDRPINLDAYAAAVEAGDPLADPEDDLAPQFIVGRPADVARSYTDSGSLDLLYNTTLAELPAGDLTVTTHLSGSTLSFRSNRTRDQIDTPASVKRNSGSGSVNLNIPLTGMGTPISDTIGNVSLNLDGNVDILSDAGTIYGYGVGLNWEPVRIVNVSANYTRRQSAPTPQQLGDAPVVTVNVPIFDYVRGETAVVTTITGGNPDLDNAQVSNFRLGINVSPMRDPQLNFSVDLSHNDRRGSISSLPGITLDTQTAFEDRFIRDDDGMLIQADLRPINITSQKSTQLRWGVNFNLQLKTPQREIQAFQEVARRRIQERIASGDIPPEAAARMQQFLNGQGGNAANGQAQPAQPGQQPAASTQAGQAQTAQAEGAQAQGTQAQGSAPSGNQAAAGQAAQGGQGEVVIVAPNGAPASGPPGGFFFGRGGPPGGGPPGGFRGPPGGFGGFGGFGGGRGGQPRGGRINFSFYHTLMIDSTAQLAPSLPVIDLLNGGTLGGGDSPSRHRIQVQAGYTQSGIGFRLFTNWSSATRSIGSAGPSSDLRIGALTTVNFRVFVNFAQMPKVVDKVPFLRGARVVVGANNLFDARQKVTDGTGATPYAYQGPFLDRTGRTVSLSFRKLFF